MYLMTYWYHGKVYSSRRADLDEVIAAIQLIRKDAKNSRLIGVNCIEEGVYGGAVGDLPLNVSRTGVVHTADDNCETFGCTTAKCIHLGELTLTKS